MNKPRAETSKTRPDDCSDHSHSQAQSDITEVDRSYEHRTNQVAERRHQLANAYTLQGVLAVLWAIGLKDDEIARAIPGGKSRSVRRWRLDGVAASREGKRWEPVDDLRAIVGYLLSDGTFDEQGALAWLRSRQAELNHERPLDVLGRGRFAEVLQAAESTLGPAMIQKPGVVGPLTKAIKNPRRSLPAGHPVGSSVDDEIPNH